jgi:hypothetical protein
MSYPRVFLSELKITLLSLTLTLFLILHVQADFLGIQSNRVDTIAPRPKMIAPIGFLLQMTKLVEHPNRTSAFNHAHQIRYGGFGEYHDNEVDMVDLDIELNHFTFEVFTKGPNTPVDLLTHLPAENTKAVFGRPYDVVLAMPQGV